jgi:acetoin utilization deacetylase AcuC-like enzyme
VRPPGHHADPDESGGFCFFNNAGIAARYAQEKYGVRKVAVLDFDIHHGNGTENGFRTSETLFYGSTHQRNGYPGTGNDPSPYVGDKAKDPLHRRIVNRYTNVGKNNSSPNFRVKWAEILSEMIRFGPNFVIISAGFDAHKFDPLSDANLVEADFEWATIEIYKACNRIDPTNSIPIISVLEGGYNIGVLGDCVLAHVKVLEMGYNCLPQSLPSATIASTSSATTESTTEDATSSSAVDEITAGLAEVAVDSSADPQ